MATSPSNDSTAVPAADSALAPTSTSNGDTATAPAAEATTSALDADEIALYDRQIRLWGAQAQERIRSAHILLISLRALGTEIAKNLTLAGISSLTIIDDDVVSEEDLGAQYFVREEDVGKPRVQAALPRIQELNPRVDVKAGCSVAELLGRNEEFYKQFSCVIACDLDLLTTGAINAGARLGGRPFYAAAIHGFYGFIFADLGSHEFIVEREKSNVPTTPGPESTTRSVLSVSSKKESGGKAVEIVKKREEYCPLILANSSLLPPEVQKNPRKLKAVPALIPCLRALFTFQRQYNRYPDHTAQSLAGFATLAKQAVQELSLPSDNISGEYLRSFLQNVGAEIVPTAAFVGGRLSEDVINVIGQREQPIQNFAFFDGDALEGKIYCLFSSTPAELLAPQQLSEQQQQQQQQQDMNGFQSMDPSMQNMHANMGDMSMMDPSMMMNLDGAGAFPMDYSMGTMNGLGAVDGMGMMGMGAGDGMAMAYGMQTNGMGGLDGLDMSNGMAMQDFQAYGTDQVAGAAPSAPLEQVQDAPTSLPATAAAPEEQVASEQPLAPEQQPAPQQEQPATTEAAATEGQEAPASAASDAPEKAAEGES